MKTPTIDHVISFYNRPNLDEHLGLYKKSGFRASEEKVRHPHGKRNSFVYFGLEYIEFMWVEDREEFESKSKEKERYFSKNMRVFSVGFVGEKLKNFRAGLLGLFGEMPETYSRGPADDPKKIWWEFLMPPIKYLPGFYSFCLSYINRDKSKPRILKIVENGVFAIAGLVLVSKKLSRDVNLYRKFFWH